MIFDLSSRSLIGVAIAGVIPSCALQTYGADKELFNMPAE